MNIDKALLEAIEKSRIPIQQNLTGAVTKWTVVRHTRQKR
jgi:hypothetical protein